MFHPTAYKRKLKYMKKYSILLAAMLALTAVSACEKKTVTPPPAAAPMAPAPDAMKPAEPMAPAAPAAPMAPEKK